MACVSSPSFSEASPRIVHTLELDESVSRLAYVRGVRVKAFEKLGIRRIRDYLLRIPVRYLDFSTQTDILSARLGDNITVCAHVLSVAQKYPRPRLSLTEIFVQDQQGVAMRLTFFRQPWLAKQYRIGERVIVSGTLDYSYGFYAMTAPFLEHDPSVSTSLPEPSAPASAAPAMATSAAPVSAARNTHALAATTQQSPHTSCYAKTRIWPVYSLTEGLSIAWYRRISASNIHAQSFLVDPMPANLIARHALMSLSNAYREIHAPVQTPMAQLARRRLAFDELMYLQLCLRVRAQEFRQNAKPFAHTLEGPHVHSFMEHLGFELSPEQQQVRDELFLDMSSPYAMNRLLMGDVGCGKTIVAALGFALCQDSNTQACMLAPTSILAQQYAQKLGPLLKSAGISYDVLTATTDAKHRSHILQALRDRQLCVLFGTTSLLSDEVLFAKLSYIVIDEQHRFGVRERTRLRQKARAADLLSMSATPIPRTLALSLFGDVETSTIHTRPYVSAPISCHVLAYQNISQAYDAIYQALSRGEQAYIVCPRVDAKDAKATVDDINPAFCSHASSIHAAVDVYEALHKSQLAEFEIGLLTGKMSNEDKDKTLLSFAKGDIKLLVTTTIIEVGIDVARASCMLILDADRFGLATLHQLRGRVGRGSIPGKVFLVSAAARHTPARTRLELLEAEQDGFKLAEKDLEFRHEGQIIGYKQSGCETLSIFDSVADADLAEYARTDARTLFERDPSLSFPAHRALKDELCARYEGLDQAFLHL